MDPLGRLFPLVAAFVDHQDAKTVISLQLAVSRVFVTISCWIYCWMVDKPPEKNHHFTIGPKLLYPSTDAWIQLHP